MNFLILDVVEGDGEKKSHEYIKIRLIDNMLDETFNDIQKLITNKKYLAIKLIKENASVVQSAE